MLRDRRRGPLSGTEMHLLFSQHRVCAHQKGRTAAAGQRRHGPFCDLPVPGAEAAAIRATLTIKVVIIRIAIILPYMLSRNASRRHFISLIFSLPNLPLSDAFALDRLFFLLEM